jgi:hypothetical protein
MIFQKGVYNQKATYWAPSATDGTGSKTFAAPQLVYVRWEDRTDLIIQSEGEEIPSKAVVYVQCSMSLGGYLALGDQTSVSDPTTLSAAYIVKSYQDSRGISGNPSLKKVMLAV